MTAAAHVDRIYWLLEKALVPLTVAALLFFGNLAARNIAKAQLESANQAAEINAKARDQEFRASMQAKYFEMFHADLASGEKQRQTTAIQLLYLMDAQLAESISKAIVDNPDASPELRAKVEIAARKIESTALQRYKIGIYYAIGDAGAESRANSIFESLRSRKVSRDIELYPRSRETLENWVAATRLEVRYEESSENLAADQLVRTLAEAPLQLHAEKLGVGTRTPGFVSIMVPAGG